MNALCFLSLAAAASFLPLPGGEGGIGLDDLVYSPQLAKLLVPSGRTGRLNLVDPKTRAIDSIEGFSVAPASGQGHASGTTSADAARGFIFASDRGRREVVVIDAAKKRIVSAAKLAAGPDYVRWVEPLGEVWVTEPRREEIERFRLQGNTLVRAGSIGIADGPESLVVDPTRGRAYTHTWHDATFVIELASARVVARWPNGCERARGIALDEKRGLLFAGCGEGKAVALDVARGGRIAGRAQTGKGVDIVAYSPRLSHLYLPGGDDATLSVVAVDQGGRLEVLGSVPTARDSHCVAADDDGNAWVCDPKSGRLLIWHDELGR